MEQKGPVLVMDGNERSALAVTRGLGRAGIPVVVGAETATSLAGASRYCVATWLYPSPLSDPSKFISSLLEAVARFDATAIMPVTDATMQVVAAQRTQFRPSIMGAVPPIERYDLVSDKYRLMALAQDLGVPVPDTVFVENGRLPNDIKGVGDYPLVVKPGRSLALVDDTWTRTAVKQVANREELERLYRETPYLRMPSLIQRRVEGEGQGIFALCDQGTPLALFAHRRLREKPPSGGVSVLRESIELPKTMTDYAVKLLEKVRWHGVAMVEFKVEGDTGIPRLMEINGRFWGSLQLALDAGVNFPHLLYQLLGGERVVLPDGGYRVGVKSRWLLGDLDHLLVRTFKSDETLRLPPGYPSRMRCVLEFIRFFQKDLQYEVERWDDPAPARYELRMYLKALVGGCA
jgi:predicted ATP-grasp superfamily ATP-dependent carboligase